MRTKSYGAIRASVKRRHAKDVPAAARPDWRQLWADRKAQWVESAWVAMMRDPSMSPWFLYYTPTIGSAWGELTAVREGTEPPAGYELVVPTRIPPGTKAQIAYWLETDGHANYLKVIPEDL